MREEASARSIALRYHLEAPSRTGFQTGVGRQVSRTSTRSKTWILIGEAYSFDASVIILMGLPSF